MLAHGSPGREAQALLDFTHNPWLVAASLAVALMAGFSGLSLTQGASALNIPQRKLTVVMAAVVLGGGIWSMHFVAMLGLRLPIFFYYDALITLVSALVAILVVGAALLVLHFQPRTPLSITAAGAVVGLGIVGMHYIGMAGMELCQPQYTVWGVGLSVVASLGLSILAIWVAYGRRTQRHLMLGTVCFGLSVFAMHFVAMLQTGFLATGDSVASGLALSGEVLALGVALAAFVISGAFLLTGVTVLQPVATEPVPAEAPALDPDPEPGPPVLADAPVPVPYEQDGTTRFAERTQIAAIRAEGHYTVLYIGADKLFCPWSISEAERRLGPFPFVRAHRSYLINPGHVTEFKRNKDTGVCFFDSVESLPKVPVSRSRLGAVREALGL